MDPGHPAPETMFLETSVEAPKVLAAVSDVRPAPAASLCASLALPRGTGALWG